jgi:hypothetical protein
MSTWAKPGVKVVCVDVSGGPWVGDILVKGNVYEIEKVGLSPVTGRPVLYLVGNTNLHYGVVTGYLIRRFRPLITRCQEQDAHLFRRLLNGLPVEENA